MAILRVAPLIAMVAVTSWAFLPVFAAENQHNPKMEVLRQKLQKDVQQMKVDQQKLTQDRETVRQDRMEMMRMRQDMMRERMDHKMDTSTKKLAHSEQHSGKSVAPKTESKPAVTP